MKMRRPNFIRYYYASIQISLYHFMLTTLELHLYFNYIHGLNISVRKTKSAMLIFLIPTLYSHAAVISSMAVGTQTLAPQGDITPMFYVESFILEPDTTAAAECLKPDLDIFDPSRYTSYQIKDWNQAAIRPNGFIDTYNYQGTMTNICLQSVSGVARLVLSRHTGESATYDVPYNVPAGNSCSVDINTAPVIPDIIRGRELPAVNFTSNAAGSGNLTFRPDESFGGKGLLKDDRGNSLTYSITGSSSAATWDAAVNQWLGNLNENYSIQLDPVQLQVPAGNYSGTMTATISCQ